MKKRKYLKAMVVKKNGERFTNPLTMSELHICKQWLNNAEIERVELKLIACSDEFYKTLFS